MSTGIKVLVTLQAMATHRAAEAGERLQCVEPPEVVINFTESGWIFRAASSMCVRVMLKRRKRLLPVTSGTAALAQPVYSH
ncbi:hypothetical protein QN219_27055 [Sinorhizobium sp. 7-81]|uniref:hypothetical protein n=1 Tax=Sinorhizobium sp. 8-89 TaxID=3049089 RepID=UPI0024C31D46|nr:hypothetical protein [Sinorhizobium sp. 8-89]MDK1493656.1 hypothetical protein [Sinorhizobium sp. 8-89]